MQLIHKQTREIVQDRHIVWLTLDDDLVMLRGLRIVTRLSFKRGKPPARFQIGGSPQYPRQPNSGVAELSLSPVKFGEQQVSLGRPSDPARGFQSRSGAICIASLQLEFADCKVYLRKLRMVSRMATQ